jgi:transposase-like protein
MLEPIFADRHFLAEVILWALRWYCRYSLVYRNVEEMLKERGLSVDHTTAARWVQVYRIEIERRLRRQPSLVAGASGRRSIPDLSGIEHPVPLSEI